MNESYGKFICYKCKNSGIFPDGGIKTEGGYKEWLCRKEYIDGELQNKYVLYNHKDEKNGIAVVVVAKQYVEKLGDYS